MFGETLTRLRYMAIQVTLFYYKFCPMILCAATVVLDSSVGMRGACPGEMVTYTCTVRQGFQLDWIVEPFVLANTDIEFTSTDTIGRSFDCNSVEAVQCEDFGFVATLTNTANMMMMSSTILADITSTLTCTASARLNWTVVQCRGSTAAGFPIVNSTFNVAGIFILYCIAYVAGKQEIKFIEVRCFIVL